LTEFEQRRRTASAQLQSRKVETLIVSSPASIRYLTGYAGSNGLILLLPSGESHFFTDPRYAADAQAHITAKVHISKKPLIQALADLLKRKRLKNIGFEPAWMNVEQHGQLQKALGRRPSLMPTAGVIEAQRAVKSPAEIALIRRSVLANSEAFARTLRRLKPGLTEQQIAAELDFQMRVLGAEKPAFDTIVASGPNSALPHAHPGARRLGIDELLLIDMGATLDGYTSDMTRMLHVGAPPPAIRKLYTAVLEAQLAGIDAVRPGITAGKVDAATRAVLKRHKLEKQFVHSTGHGLGIEIHETPRLGQKEKTKLQAGMVITIEPGAYVQGLGGVRIEDTVLVTDRGCEVLTPTPKELVNL
jgi:Xaa-Pro aminopeptidase